jgi:septum formation protein
MRLILASASPVRLRVLREAGFAPEVIVSDVDETGVDHYTPPEAVRALAERKAENVAERLGTGDHLVVGCDSMLEIDGEMRGKPSSLAEARRWWQSMAGRSGVLHTGHAVIDGRNERLASATASTTVRHGTPTPTELDALLTTGEALRVAGAFTIDGYAAPFVDSIEGDHSNVLGLSLPTLRLLLRELGVTITDLWAPPGGADRW